MGARSCTKSQNGQKWPKINDLPDPPPILELGGAINVSFGFWGVFGYVFDLTEWFGHIICGYDKKLCFGKDHPVIILVRIAQ